MAKCEQCSTSIIFGGVYEDGDRFCNQRCARNYQVVKKSLGLPAEFVRQQVSEVHQGACPKCLGQGPVDVHYAYQVWSALVLTSWENKPLVSCRKCARNKQIGASFFSLFLGWWGFPWGIIMTPVQIGRNITAMAGGPNPNQPSKNLEKLVRMNLATQPGFAGARKSPPPLPPPLPSR